MLETALLALGGATTKLVARIWLRSETSLILTDDVVDLLRDRIPGALHRRVAGRQFEAMSDRIAKQVAVLIENDGGNLPDNEARAAILGVGRVVDDLQRLGKDYLFSIDFDPIALENAARSQTSMRVRQDLVESAQLLFDRLLSESCTYVIELCTALPQFESEALVEILQRETEILERVEAVFARLPSLPDLRADDDQQFESRYRRFLARELDRLELFGLTLSDSANRYNLSTAYITLSALATSDDTRKASPQLLVAGSSHGEPPAADPFEGTALRVDAAMASGSRHLIRGEAGSGKTTLLQWLAVTAAREEFSESLEDWNNIVPLFVQLRRYANTTLPETDQFLRYSASTIYSGMPEGWVDRVLSGGRGLVLIDGADELPDAQRRDARDWIASLVEEFPNCRFIVTTRPPAVPDDWLEAYEFNVLELLPMSLADIQEFIQHWYDAARRSAGYRPSEVQELDAYQSELVRVIRDMPPIRSLATAPLLCAMLCALNRDRRTQLPKDRMELYRIALESLLDRRDVERRISQNERVSLGLREKETLLQDLAYWLILNDQTDISRERAVERLASRLAFMSSIAASDAEVFGHLLSRSGILREPVDGRVDFIHRSFQEFLGAARIVAEGHIPWLIDNAHNDQLREVIILAAGHASTIDAANLIEGLLDRGSARADLRHRLHLLAVACLETAIEVPPEVIHRVRAALAGTLPPTNMTEARAVASAGPVAAPMLAEYARERATTAAACVRTLCLIGGDAGIAALTNFGADNRVTVARELLRGWDYFDTERYAMEVLGNSPLDRGTVEVGDSESLSAARHLNNLRGLRLRPRGRFNSLEGFENLALVTDLQISRGSDASRLEGLEECVRLVSFSIAFAPNLSDIRNLPDSVSRVGLTVCPELRELGRLAELEALENLQLQGVDADLRGLSGATVRDLHLSGIPAWQDSEWISSLGALERLSVFGRVDKYRPFGDNGSLRAFSMLETFRDLTIFSASGIVSLEGLPDRVSRVFLMGARDLRDASRLSALENLTELALDGATKLADFDFLRSLPDLKVLDLEGCQAFSDLSLLESAKDMRRILLAGTSVTSLKSLENVQSLNFLKLDHCPIDDLTPILSFQKRCHIVIDAEQNDLVSDEMRSRHLIRVSRSHR